MRKKTPFPAKITVGIATSGIILMMFGVTGEKKAILLMGLAMTLTGFFASFVVSIIMDIKKTYPSRDDPYQKKMRLFRYVRLIAGSMSFLSVALVLYGLYNVDKGTKPIMYLGLMLIAGGIVAVVALSLIMAAASRSADPQYASKSAVSPSDSGAAHYSADPVISRILANPYVLLDERIRQIHEVQNLLQYPEIQQIFFEPAKLYSLFAQERVGELLNVVRDWIAQNNADEIFAAAESRRPANASTVRTNKSVRKSSMNKSTMVGVIIVLTLWVFVFAAIVSVVLRSFK